MIFVTVGAQMPFDRLVRAVDAWAVEQNRSDIFAQIGPTDQCPAHLEWIRFLDPPQFRERLFEAELVVTHAGMGTILSALEFGKPILVLPRRASLRETRNDHQFDTARALAERGQVTMAADEHELRRHLNQPEDIRTPARVASHASFTLLETLRDFIRGEQHLPVAESSPTETVLPAALSLQRETREARGPQGGLATCD